MVDVAEEISRITKTDIQTFSKIMTFIQKQHPKVEDEVLPDFYVGTQHIDLHDMSFAALVGGDFSMSRSMLHTSPMHYFRKVPSSVRDYALTHALINSATLPTEITKIDFEDQVNDQVGSNDGTWTGSAVYSNASPIPWGGKHGVFDGTKRVNLANESAFDRDITDPFTVACWIKYDSSSGTKIFWIKGGFADNTYGLFRSSNKAVFRIRTSVTGVLNLTSDSNLGVGGWRHVVVTKGASANMNAMKIYIDGVLDKTGTSTPFSGTMLNNEDMTLMAEHDGANAEAGKMDAWQFWDSELTADQVATLYADSVNAELTFPHEMDEGLYNGMGVKSDGLHYIETLDHANLDATELLVAMRLKLPATDAGDTAKQMILGKEGQFEIYIEPHATEANSVRVVTFTAAAEKGFDFNYTPDTWFSIVIFADNVNITIYKDGSSIGTSATGTKDTTSNKMGIMALGDGTLPLKAGCYIALLAIGDKSTDATWVSDYENDVLDWDGGTDDEITTFPFIADWKPQPNSHSGFFQG